MTSQPSPEGSHDDPAIAGLVEWMVLGTFLAFVFRSGAKAIEAAYEYTPPTLDPAGLRPVSGG